MIKNKQQGKRRIPNTPLLLALLFALLPGPAAAQISNGEIRVGLLVDLKGSYAHITGVGSIVAAQMAIEDAGGTVLGRPIKLMAADHGNDPATAAEIAQQWLAEGGVDVLGDVAGSPPALAVQEVNRKYGAVVFYNSVMTPALTGSLCAPTGIHWMYDGYAYNQVIGGELTRQGARKWALLSVDNEFGRDVENSLAAIIGAHGGRVVSSVRHARGERHLFDKLKASVETGAEVIGLINAGQDFINAVRQALDPFGIGKGKVRLAAVATTINDVHTLQPQVAQGLLLSHSFYWNQDEASRAWSERFWRRTGAMPNDLQAGVYSALTHYFKAVAAAKTDRGIEVVAKMRELPIRDPIVRNARLRADGRMVHDIYLMQVKKPAEVSKPWDYLTVVRTIPGDRVFRPLAEGGCPLVKQ